LAKVETRKSGTAIAVAIGAGYLLLPPQALAVLTAMPNIPSWSAGGQTMVWYPGCRDDDLARLVFHHVRRLDTCCLSAQHRVPAVILPLNMELSTMRVLEFAAVKLRQPAPALAADA
jgi:hypothetical protein